MHRLLEESKRVKEQADKILKESGIIEILKEYGEVKIGGSYSLDVMLRPDIDIFVIAPKHNWEGVLKISRKIMESRYFREFDFVNWVDFEDKNTINIKGYYFQPWVPMGNQLWKMDIWLITSDQDESMRQIDNFDHFKKLLDQEKDNSKRIAILEIKEAMREGKKYIKGVNGNLIYKAVLENGIMSVEKFKQMIKVS